MAGAVLRVLVRNRVVVDLMARFKIVTYKPQLDSDGWLHLTPVEPAPADAPPRVREDDPVPVRFSECALPDACGMWRRRAEHIDRCAYCDKGLLEHSIEAIVAGNGHSPSPPQPDDYAARRAEVARRRNPQGDDQPKINVPLAGTYRWVDRRSRYIARAVRALSHFEPRLGVARWEP